MTNASRWSAAILTGLLALVIAWFTWQTAWNRDISFLPYRAPAEWIIYPTPTDYESYPPIELAARFRRSFRLDQTPASARLSVRGFRDARFIINGRTVSYPDPGRNWKKIVQTDIGPLLRPGENEIVALVRNRGAPPALWLYLEAGAVSVASDETWIASLAGAADQAAQRARVPLPALREPLPFASPLDAARRRWPWLLGCVGLAAIATLGCWFGWRSSGPSGTRLVTALYLLIVLFWIVLAWHNGPWIASSFGFDAGGHIDYVAYLQREQALPLANDGWEMFQPPFFYLVGAATLGTFGEVATTEAGANVLRGVSLVGGLLQLTFLWLSFRVLFADSPMRQAVALIVTALLPAHLYLHQYVTNEGWAAAWTTGAIYFTLRLVVPPARASLVDGIGVGLCLGLGLLTKLTPAISALVLVTVLAGQTVLRWPAAPRAWLQRVLVPVLLCGLVAGWHYVRVWSHFGNPFIANWDPQSGFAWWQQPGFQTTESLFRFGRVLFEPFLVGGRGVVEGIYGTLWGDGGLGGSTQPWVRPPWNYDLMSLGYWLALLPTALVILGALATGIEQLRRPSAAGAVLLGVAAALGLAILGMNLSLPYYSLAKGFFALGGAVSLGAFAAQGMDVLFRRAPWLFWFAAVFLGAWAMNAGASFYIQPGTNEALLSRASGLLNTKAGADQAQAVLEQILEKNPDEPSALTLMAMSLAERGDTKKALELLTRASQADPTDAGAPIGRAILLSNLGQDETALELTRVVTAAHPDYQSAWALLGQLLRKRGDRAGAVRAYRECLRLRPSDPEAHGALSVLYSDGKEAIAAIEHAETARALGKQDPDVEIAQAVALVILGRLPDAKASLQAAIVAFKKSGLDTLRLRQYLASLSETDRRP